MILYIEILTLKDHFIQVMHAYLIIGDNPENTEKIIKKLSTDKNLVQREFPFEKINDVRNLIKYLNLKITKPTAIILKNIHLSTHEAQSAFLKSLEEPQENLIYILTSDNLNLILPTIVSRSKIIYSQKYHYIDGEDLKLTEKFFIGGLGEKFSIIDTIRIRENAIHFVNNLLTYCQEKTITEGHQKWVYFSEKIISARKSLKKNGMLNLQLSNMALGIYRIELFFKNKSK